MFENSSPVKSNSEPFELCLDHFVLLAGLALFQYFSDTENDFQTVSQSQVNFFFKDFVGFVVVGTTLGVTQNDILWHRSIFTISAGNLTRVSTAGLVPHSSLRPDR